MKNDTDTDNDDSLVLRHPTMADGADIHALITACPPLDANSVYAYLLQAQYFQDTCVIAHRNGESAGFVSGFIVPQRHDTLFIWQVAVHPSQRGCGLAASMLDFLLQKHVPLGVRHIETTVSPGNEGSRALFQALARRWSTVLSESPLFDSSLFGGLSHEDEPLLKLGPLKLSGPRSIIQ